MKITKAQIAHHEAGHAVVAWLCDHYLGEVTIRRDRRMGTLGSVQHHEQGLNDLFEVFELHADEDAPGGFVVRTGEQSGRYLTSDEIHGLDLHERLSGQNPDEQYVMIAAAGEAAERRHSPEAVEPGGAQDDWESVFEHLERLAGKPGLSQGRVRSKLTAQTVSLLDDPLVWRMIVGVADALLAKETLMWGEVKSAIRKGVRGDDATWRPDLPPGRAPPH